jgi:hypothetical protein
VALFKKIRIKVGNYFLNRRLRHLKRKRQLLGFEASSTVGVLFKTDNLLDFESVRKFLLYLHEKQNQVFAIGFIDNKKIPDYFLMKKGFNFFTRKELTFFFIPKSKVVDDFLEKQFDILIDLSTDNSFPLQYISSMSRSKFKIGRSANGSKCFDLMIDTEKNNKVDFLVEHIKHYTAILTAV